MRVKNYEAQIICNNVSKDDLSNLLYKLNLYMYIHYGNVLYAKMLYSIYCTLCGVRVRSSRIVVRGDGIPALGLCIKLLQAQGRNELLTVQLKSFNAP